MKDRFLIVVDGSFFQYYVLFGAVYEFQRNFPDEAAKWIKPVEQCDQKNLPNLLNCAKFKGVLKKYVMKRLETIDGIAKQNFQNELDCASGVDIVFALDDRVKYSFRINVYPQYKAQRQFIKRQYQVQPIKDYIVNVIFPELDVCGKYGYRLIKVEGAEGDDVIATALTRFKDRYMAQMLIASDHDFLQIDGVREFNLFGKEITRDLGGEIVDADQYLLGKILMGDKSDNIKQVFSKCGPKTALKLVKDKERLRQMLSESRESADRFLLNRKIISFTEIPEELSRKIQEEISRSLYTEERLNEGKMDLSQFMNL